MEPCHAPNPRATKRRKLAADRNIASTKKRTPTKQRAQRKNFPEIRAPTNASPSLARQKTRKEIDPKEVADIKAKLKACIDDGERQFVEEWQQAFTESQKVSRAGQDLDPSWLGHTTEQSSQHDGRDFIPQRDIFRRTFPEPVTKDAQNKAIHEITAQLHQALHSEEQGPSSDDMTIRKAMDLVIDGQMSIVEFCQFHLPDRLVTMRNSYLQDKRSEAEKDKELQHDLVVEHQSELRTLQGTTVPFPDNKTYLGFLSMISTESPKEISNIFFVFMVKAFQTWYQLQSSMNVNNVGCIDFDISHPVRECRHLIQPVYEKCIITFRCYSIWVVVCKSSSPSTPTNAPGAYLPPPPCSGRQISENIRLLQLLA